MLMVQLKIPTKYLLNESLVYERIKWRRRAKLKKVLITTIKLYWQNY